MFDVGFSELLIIGIVALIVIGPEKLPAVARTVGHLLGRAQRYVNDVKTDINREMQLEELKKLQSQMTDSVRTMEQSVRNEMSEAQAALSNISSEVSQVSQVNAEVSDPVDVLAPPPQGQVATAPAAVPVQTTLNLT
jgi:sec-independent protein translocase protein TatB